MRWPRGRAPATRPTTAPTRPPTSSAGSRPQLLAFSTGTGTDNTLDKSYTNVLPSFNVRFGFTDTQFMRFGYSKGMSRPDFGLLRNSVAINAPPIDTSNSSPYLIRDAQGTVTGYNFVFAAEAGYAGLEPVEADNFDLSYESVLQQEQLVHAGPVLQEAGERDRLRPRDARHRATTARRRTSRSADPPTTRAAAARSRASRSPTRRSSTSCPAHGRAWACRLNYTHTEQEDINNSNLAVQAGYLPGSTTAFGGGNNTSTGGQGNAGNPLSFTSNVIDSHRLAGISDDSFNVVGLYEYGKIGARLAYSWRSEFLTANLDCCIGLAGVAEGERLSRWLGALSINDNIELSLDVSNILNTTAVTQQQVFGDSTLTPGANPVKLDSGWVRNDRRYQLGVRFKY